MKRHYYSTYFRIPSFSPQEGVFGSGRNAWTLTHRERLVITEASILTTAKGGSRLNSRKELPVKQGRLGYRLFPEDLSLIKRSC